MREFTKEEQQIFPVFDEEMRSKGLHIEDDEFGRKNGEMILAQFENRPVTLAGLKAVVETLRSELTWKSAAQLEYEKAYHALTTDQQNAFGTWWFNQKRTLTLEGEEGFRNAALIIAWMRGRTFDARGLDLAVSNLAANSRRPLHWAIREQQSSGRPSHKDDGKGLFPKDEVNLTARQHAARAKQAAAIGRISEEPVTNYRSLAEAVRGNNHSQTEQIRKMFTMKSGTSSVDWEQTYAARRRAAGL